MTSSEQLEADLQRPSPGTLGQVLYADRSNRPVAEAEWIALVRAIGLGDAQALHALYERAHRVVFTLALRITCNREMAEELTIDVFHDVWRSARGYDPANATVLGWIMNQARSRSIERLRLDQRKRGCADGQAGVDLFPGPDPGDARALQKASAQLRDALRVLTPQERRTVECTFLGGLTQGETAARLGMPVTAVKTHIHAALQKLSAAMGVDSADSVTG